MLRKVYGSSLLVVPPAIGATAHRSPRRRSGLPDGRRQKSRSPLKWIQKLAEFARGRRAGCSGCSGGQLRLHLCWQTAKQQEITKTKIPRRERERERDQPWRQPAPVSSPGPRRLSKKSCLLFCLHSLSASVFPPPIVSYRDSCSWGIECPARSVPCGLDTGVSRKSRHAELYDLPAPLAYPPINPIFRTRCAPRPIPSRPLFLWNAFCFPVFFFTRPPRPPVLPRSDRPITFFRRTRLSLTPVGEKHPRED